MYNAVTIHVDFKFPIMINQAVRETGEHDQLSAAGGDPASAHGSQTHDTSGFLSSDGGYPTFWHGFAHAQLQVPRCQKPNNKWVDKHRSLRCDV